MTTSEHPHRDAAASSRIARYADLFERAVSIIDDYDLVEGPPKEMIKMLDQLWDQMEHTIKGLPLHPPPTAIELAIKDCVELLTYEIAIGENDCDEVLGRKVYRVVTIIRAMAPLVARLRDVERSLTL